jgi:hypothetical protein
MPTRPCAWTSKPAPRRHANYDGATFRLPLRGQHRLTRSMAGGRPVSRLTACARARIRAPEVRASVGPAPRAVKETQAGRAYRTGLACAIVCARLVPAHAFACAVKRETGSAPALNLCCPRNGKRPAAQFFAAPRMRFQSHCPARSNECGREGKAREAASPDTGQTRRRPCVS